ncbi:MAG: DUF4214 domain-containing protein [Acidimicrobiales bacterium]|nr:DUF4214 domain-containing protein [Acidimicrobiales bacterium]
MKKTFAAALVTMTTLTGLVAPAAATDPIDPVPLVANLYEFDISGGPSISGVGYLAAPTSVKGPTLSVEIDGLTPNTTYLVRLAGPTDANDQPTSCSDGDAALAEFKPGASEFTVDGGALSAGVEGVLRWTFDELAPFSGADLVDMNNGEPAVVVTTNAGTIVACGELGGSGNTLPNPTSRSFPLARLGGSTPQNINGSDVRVSGQVNLTGSLLTYDFTVRGNDLIDDPAGGLENHLIMLRSTDACTGTIDNALTNTVASITNFNRSSDAATTRADLNDVFFRSYISSGTSLNVVGSVILPGIDQNSIKDYGLIIMGLEGASTAAQPGEPQVRQMTPSACLSFVDNASEVGPVPLADATTLEQIINSDEYRPGTDPEILRLYNAFFNRVPDVVGAKYWIGVSKGEVDGKTYKNIEIARFFTTSSAEFGNFYENAPSDEAFLTRVYENVLGRGSDPSGYAYWLDILKGTNASGLNPDLARGDRADVVFYVALGAEFVGANPYLPG